MLDLLWLVLTAHGISSQFRILVGSSNARLVSKVGSLSSECRDFDDPTTPSTTESKCSVSSIYKLKG